MMVPADAEWVLEGEFVSEDYRTPVASEDLGLGFIWGEALWPLFKVNCITHRTRPIWTATTFSSVGSVDHTGVHMGLSFGGLTADAFFMLRQAGYLVKDITIKGIWVCIVQLEVDGQDKPHPNYGLEVGRMIGAKYTVVVGPDIDINNLEEVLWAIGTRAPRNEWVDLPQQLPGKPPIPRYGVFNELTTDMGFTVIDATIPAPGRFDTFPPRTEPPLWEREAISRMRNMLSAE
jgi:UbiD family decarboxylase